MQIIEIAINALDIASIRPLWKAVQDYADADPEDSLVDIEGEAVSVPVGMQGLAAAEREPEIGDGLQGELGDEVLEWGERHRRVSAQPARIGCWASQNSRTARGRVSEPHSRRSRSAFR